MLNTASDDHHAAPADPPKEMTTQAILSALATETDVQKVRAAHPGLTEERMRACLREAADWAAREHVEPRLVEKLLTALLLPLLAAVAASSYRFMLPLVHGCNKQFLEMDLGTLPNLSIWYLEWVVTGVGGDRHY